MNIALKFLMSPQLERRLNGLGFLQNIVESAQNARLYPSGIRVIGMESDADTAYYQRVETSTFLTCETLLAVVPVTCVSFSWCCGAVVGG